LIIKETFYSIICFNTFGYWQPLEGAVRWPRWRRRWRPPLPPAAARRVLVRRRRPPPRTRHRSRNEPGDLDATWRPNE